MYFLLHLRYPMVMASLYFHIPFCVKKCPYCDFISSPCSGNVPEEYVAALLREMELRAAVLPIPTAETIYFGGGTPSLLDPADVGRIIDSARRLFVLSDDAEVTLEANPGTVNLGRLQGYRSAGVNRLSLGVQALDNALLKRIGRVHSADEAREAFRAARRAGFENVGIDLIHSLPGQTMEMWHHALLEAVNLGPEHISAYGLTIEEGTPFATMEEKGDLFLPGDDLAARMFVETADFLSAHGYEHYEISNFARPGLRSRHNQVYWRRRSYLGFGAAAHSFLDTPLYGLRWSNAADTEGYIDAIGRDTIPEEDTRIITLPEALSEFMFLGLRIAEGVNCSAIHDEIGVSPFDYFRQQIDDLLAEGLLEGDSNSLQVKQDALVVSNRVLVRFV